MEKNNGRDEGRPMNRWYKKTVTKAVLLVLAVLSGAIFTTNLFGALTIAGTATPA